MSNIPVDPNATTATTVPPTDPNSFAAFLPSGISSVGSSFPYQDRAIKGVSSSFTPEQQTTILGKIRQASGNPLSPKMYSGEYLVDENSVISRAPYDTKQDQYDELYKLSDFERSSYLNVLASRGFYGSGKPSQLGTLDKDRAAFQELLTYANARGRTWRGLIGELLTMPGTGVTRGNRYRVSAPEDITAYLRKSSLERLGRTMSKADVDKAIAAIQQQEATKGPAAPAVSVMAEQQVSKLNPNREKAYNYRQAIDGFMALLGGNG